jgi:hypothetical protein
MLPFKQMRLLSIDVGVRNLGMCVLIKSPTSCTLKKWLVVDCAGDENVARLSIARACELVINKLDSLEFGTVDACAIEMQPCGKVAANTKMKCVSHTIQIWARLRFPLSHIVFINPKTKFGLEFIGKKLNLEKGPQAIKKRYKKHKKAVVAAVTKIVDNEFPSWSNFFINLAKKDDVADALLIAKIYIARYIN